MPLKHAEFAKLLEEKIRRKYRDLDYFQSSTGNAFRGAILKQKNQLFRSKDGFATLALQAPADKEDAKDLIGNALRYSNSIRREFLGSAELIPLRILLPYNFSENDGWNVAEILMTRGKDGLIEIDPVVYDFQKGEARAYQADSDLSAAVDLLAKNLRTKSRIINVGKVSKFEKKADHEQGAADIVVEMINGDHPKMEIVTPANAENFVEFQGSLSAAAPIKTLSRSLSQGTLVPVELQEKLKKLSASQKQFVSKDERQSLLKRAKTQLQKIKALEQVVSEKSTRRAVAESPFVNKRSAAIAPQNLTSLKTSEDILEAFVPANENQAPSPSLQQPSYVEPLSPLSSPSKEESDLSRVESWNGFPPTFSATSSEIKIPSASPKVGEKSFVVSLATKVEAETKIGIWIKSVRKNNYRTLDGAYGKDKSDDERRLEERNMMRDILLHLTTHKSIRKINAGENLSLGDLLKIIDLAKKKGGVNYKKTDADSYEKQNLDEIEDIDSKLAKAFSGLYQRQCEACGIYSGREFADEDWLAVGSRLTFVLDDVRDEIAARQGEVLSPKSIEAVKSAVQDKELLVKKVLSEKVTFAESVIFANTRSSASSAFSR
ncbi:MAG: hypothetical protein KA100_06355 [Rickettsiales bacterium]|nr:hypothetical protein [Rickettsiales bacterium]